jgi:hypothetical protein
MTIWHQHDLLKNVMSLQLMLQNLLHLKWNDETAEIILLPDNSEPL